MPPKDPNNPNQLPPLPGGTPMPQPDATGAQPDPEQQANDILSGGKIDTPVGPITPPNPAAVQASGGIGGYFKGVLGKLPKALAIMESSYGNPAPLQAIQQQEALQQRGIQQQFENTVTAQRENRAQQLYGVQLKNFQSELQYRQVQTQMQQQKLLDDQHLRHAQEIVENAKGAFGPDAVAAAHRYLMSVGQEKPEPEQYVMGQDGQYYRLPKTGAAGPPVAQPVMTNQVVPGPTQSGAPLVNQAPLIGQTGPKDDVAETFKLGVAQGKYTNDNPGWLQAERDVAVAKHVVDPNVQGNRVDARVDKSYQFHTTQLNSIAKPILDRQNRLANLQTSIMQKDPVADALIAPELLTAMAGGQGSGLRMNEAEIARIVGGTNNWQQIKSSLLKWQADPSKPFQILDPQRAQIRKLIAVMAQRSTQQSKILEDAQYKIAMSEDPMEHRRIYADTRRQLDEIMSGALLQAPTAPPKGAAIVPMH